MWKSVCLPTKSDVIEELWCLPMIFLHQAILFFQEHLVFTMSKAPLKASIRLEGEKKEMLFLGRRLQFLYCMKSLYFVQDGRLIIMIVP